MLYLRILAIQLINKWEIIGIRGGISNEFKGFNDLLIF